MRVCKFCQEEKNEAEFFHGGIKGGKIKPRPRCVSCHKKCVNAAARKKWSENPEARASKRKYIEKNKERDRAWQKKYRENNINKKKARQYSQVWRKKNKSKCAAYNMKYRHKSPENMKRHTRAVIASQKRSMEKYPEKAVLKRMRHHFKRIIKGVKSSRSFAYIGISSFHEFISRLSSKTENPHWIRDGYQIDHIWQLNWFDEMIEIKNWAETISFVVHHHSNLRPLAKPINLIRSFYDFSPLKQEDFQKFEPYLNESVKLALLKYWENLHLFSGAQINKCSEEERVLLKLIA